MSASKSDSVSKQGPLEPWTVAECQGFDRFLQAECGLSASLLMENAGAALAARIRDLQCGRILFLVGPGNNGGDALVAARQLQGEPGLEMLLLAPLGAPQSPGSAALTALRATQGVGLGLRESPLRPGEAEEAGLVVDGLFGVGLTRAVAGKAADTVQAVAASGTPVLAVDLPTGLDGDTGAARGALLPARWTLSFVAPKRGMFRDQGPAACGQVEVAGIGVSAGFAAAWCAARRAAPVKDG